MLETQTVLVTGGAGFIGCALSRLAADGAARWVVLDSLHPQVHARPGRPDGLHPAAELRVGDVTDPATWDAVLADVRPDVVVHLAAETGTAQSLDAATRHGSVNVVGTTVMLDALSRHQVVPSRIVLSSSRAVYGEGAWMDLETGEVRYPGQRTHAQLESGRWDFPGLVDLASEAGVTMPAPTSVYGATKLAQEHVLSAWCGARGSELVTLRLQNVYGPGQSLTNSYTGIVSTFAQLARAGSVVPVYEDGLITRDFVVVDDVAGAFTAALTGGAGVAGAPIDIGTGRATTVLDLARGVASMYGAPEPQVTGAFRDGDIRSASCVVTAARDRLGWSATTSLDEGLHALQAWIEEELVGSASRRS